MLVYYSRLNTLEEKGADYVLSLKSKGAYTSKLNPLYTTFLHSIKFSGYRMGIKLIKIL